MLKHFEDHEVINHCSAEKAIHFLGLSAKIIGSSSLSTDAVKYRVGNDYFQPISTYLFVRMLSRPSVLQAVCVLIDYCQ